MFVFLLEMQRGSGKSGRSGRAGRAGKSGKSGKAQGLRQGYVQGGKGVRCQPSERLMRVCVCVCVRVLSFVWGKFLSRNECCWSRNSESCRGII